MSFELDDQERAGFLLWVRSGRAEIKEVQDWLLAGCGFRSYLDAYVVFVLKKRTLKDFEPGGVGSLD